MYPEWHLSSQVLQFLSNFEITFFYSLIFFKHSAITSIYRDAASYLPDFCFFSIDLCGILIQSVGVKTRSESRPPCSQDRIGCVIGFCC